MRKTVITTARQTRFLTAITASLASAGKTRLQSAIRYQTEQNGFIARHTTTVLQTVADLLSAQNAKLLMDKKEWKELNKKLKREKNETKRQQLHTQIASTQKAFVSHNRKRYL